VRTDPLIKSDTVNVRLLLRTSTFQLSMRYMLLFTISVLVLFGVLYWSTVGSLYREINATIDAEISGLAEQYERQGLRGLIDVVAKRVQRQQDERSIYLFADSSLQLLAGNMDHWPQDLLATGRWFEFNKVTANGGNVPVRAKVLSVGRNLRLLVGREIHELAELKRVFKRAAILGIGAVLLVAFTGGLLISIAAERRVSAINRTARQIIEGDLSQRIPLIGSRDEYDSLAININAMLDQIEALLSGIRHVGDSIAHDLKTPLTRLRNKLEELSVDGSHDSTQQIGLNECIEESDRLLATFNALLRIARIESGAYRSAFRTIDLAEIARDAFDLYQPAAEEKQITLACHCDDTEPLFGDRELLAQAIVNLLDNSIKYVPVGGHVELAIRSESDHVRLTIADSGPGIAEDEITNVERRFVRLDQARSESGNGLGLTLVRAVVEQHRGRMIVENMDPGLRVSLELPRSTMSVK
jgi:signal transduction histidine kinase